MNKPTVSIITVCYNSAKTIESTIRSVMSQNYPRMEYIIIDGGSRDGTLDILERYRTSITRVVSEPDQGIYDAMNKGIKLARGEYIGLLNADDIYANNEIISNMVLAFQEKDVDACYGDLIYFSDENPDKIQRYWKSSPFLPGLFAKGWCPPHPTFFVKREIYSRLGAFNTTYRLGNDVELMMRFLEKYKIKSHYLPEIIVKMRLGGVSNRALKNIIMQNISILQAAKHLGIPISVFSFFFYKLGNRLSQLIKRPKRGSSYANYN